MDTQIGKDIPDNETNDDETSLPSGSENNMIFFGMHSSS